MKSRGKIVFLLNSVFMVFNCLLNAQEGREPRPEGRGMIWKGLRTPPKCNFELPGPKGPGFPFLDEEDPHYEWFEADEVAVCDDGVYTDSNKGMMKLNVVEYDPIGNRYLVRCRCLEDPHLDPSEALSVPYEDSSE